MLINLEEIRKIDIKKKLDMYMTLYQKRINYADQDVLNGSFKNQIGILPPEYDIMTIVDSFSYKDIICLRKPKNYYTEEEILEAIKNPKIIHYTTNMITVRPWYSNADHPYTDLFRNYLKISPWKDIKLKEFNFSSSESRIIKIINKMPKMVSIPILGFLHTVFKPITIRIKSKVNPTKKKKY